MKQPPAHVLPTIVFAQFAGTSLWFAGNAVAANLQADLGLNTGAIGWLTSAVQLGFIAGTLVFAFLAIADRFSPVRIFLVCALMGAASTLVIALSSPTLPYLLLLRFLTGCFLAGIYPVGMKIAADWFEGSLGKAIGFLVGALVLGTAFPHLIKGMGAALPWQQVLYIVAGLAALGGLTLFLLVGDGPYRKTGARFQPKSVLELFRLPAYRGAALGYFGHMWELYAFWAMVPAWLGAYQAYHSLGELPVAYLSFAIIGFGSISCAVGGLLSLRRGSAWVARLCLRASGLCCLLSPLAFLAPPAIFILFLICWGLAVIADSAQFSALAAQGAPKALTGTALTIMNSLGFLITIGSIQLTAWLLSQSWNQYLLIVLLIGPIIGLWGMRKLEVSSVR